MGEGCDEGYGRVGGVNGVVRGGQGFVEREKKGNGEDKTEIETGREWDKEKQVILSDRIQPRTGSTA